MSAVIEPVETEVRGICRDPNDPQFGGYVVNCHRETRGEVLFLITADQRILPMLDGYAIIPIEKYRELTREHPERSRAE